MSSGFSNNSDATVLSGISRVAEMASAIDIAVSYVQVSGWKSLQPLIDRLPSGKVRVLFTDQFALTHPGALELALKGEAAVRRYVGGEVYHPKVYIARDKTGRVQRALVGSANLSSSGLLSGVEGAVLLDRGTILETIGQWFDALWGAAEEVDNEFVQQYRPNWRNAARARIRMRRFRRRAARPTRAEPKGTPDDVDVLEDLCGTIRLPITILSIDQAGNNVRNLKRLLSVLHAFPNVSGKARSELHLLGMVDGGELTEIGRRARRCQTNRTLARTWCGWLKGQRRKTLAAINPKIANFKRCATLFWKLRPEVVAFFFDHLEDRAERDVLKAIELLCNGDDAVRELKLEDFKSLAPVLAEPTGLPAPLREAVESYHRNKGSRSWRGNDRRILLESFRSA
jgi:HKD family nuclease